MTREEFIAEFERLGRAYRQPTTPERMDAVYRIIGHQPVGALREAIDQCLLDPRPPLGDKLLASVEKAADHARLSEFRQRQPFLPSRLSDDVPDREYGQARLDLVKAMLKQRYSHQRIAIELERIADEHPHHADACMAEARGYAEHG